LKGRFRGQVCGCKDRPCVRGGKKKKDLMRDKGCVEDEFRRRQGKKERILKKGGWTTIPNLGRCGGGTKTREQQRKAKTRVSGKKRYSLKKGRENPMQKGRGVMAGQKGTGFIEVERWKRGEAVRAVRTVESPKQESPSLGGGKMRRSLQDRGKGLFFQEEEQREESLPSKPKRAPEPPLSNVSGKNVHHRTKRARQGKKILRHTIRQGSDRGNAPICHRAHASSRDKKGVRSIS